MIVIMLSCSFHKSKQTECLCEEQVSVELPSDVLVLASEVERSFGAASRRLELALRQEAVSYLVMKPRLFALAAVAKQLQLLLPTAKKLMSLKADQIFSHFYDVTRTREWQYQTLQHERKLSPYSPKPETSPEEVL